MTRQPAQSGFVQAVRKIDSTVDASRRYLVQTLSSRIAQSTFDSARARFQADKAQDAAVAANAAANVAYNQGVAAAGAAQSAASAAAAAQGAANTANASAARLGRSKVWYADPTGGATIPGGTDPANGATWQTIPQMEKTDDFSGGVILVRFSAEVYGDVHAAVFWQGTIQGFSYRQGGGAGSTLSFTYAFEPNGYGKIDVRWAGSGGSDQRRRQLSIQRIATP